MHGNPRIFSPNDKCHPFKKQFTAEQLYNATIDKENKIKDLGYNLVVMWEDEWKQICKNKKHMLKLNKQNNSGEI